jgi:hypothetical protein
MTTYEKGKTQVEHTNSLDKLKKRIINELQNGLNHGFFEIKIYGESTQNNTKKQITLKVGKTYKFTIPTDELENS